jgi:hypothetical protein
MLSLLLSDHGVANVSTSAVPSGQIFSDRVRFLIKKDEIVSPELQTQVSGF